MVAVGVAVALLCPNQPSHPIRLPPAVRNTAVRDMRVLRMRLLLGGACSRPCFARHGREDPIVADI